MRPQGTALQLEKRRRQAIRLLKAGKNLSVVARALSASVSSLFRWYSPVQEMRRQRAEGSTHAGRPPRLSKSQKPNLGKVLLKGPLAAGHRTDLWTLQKVAEVIDERFGVQYHTSHVWKLLQGLGWRCQIPDRRALQRDEEPMPCGSALGGAIQKNTERLGAHLVTG